MTLQQFGLDVSFNCHKRSSERATVLRKIQRPIQKNLASGYHIEVDAVAPISRSSFDINEAHPS